MVFLLIFGIAVISICGYIALKNYKIGKVSNPTDDVISARVKGYEPLITKYATEYDIPEYVNLIKAVMMQESTGKGTDPMQASESEFNIKYPRKPSAIKNAEYSINVGIKTLAYHLKATKTSNPIDTKNLKLALQSYNYGSPYTSWAKDNYGGYSYENAEAYSAHMKDALKTDVYGDPKYVNHVLRYYPFKLATKDPRANVVNLAKTQEGNVGGDLYWKWWGYPKHVKWCAIFVSWCAANTGLIDNNTIPKFENCQWGAEWFITRNRFKSSDSSYIPKKGDIVFIDLNENNLTNHVAFVDYYENGNVHIIEGNNKDRCTRNVYKIDSKKLYGYGLPDYQ
ncbi:MAG: lysozyme family protein [Lachnospiraceae bacterium]|nr:lysozyme family protein [Lachnospiraceae bacterium]